MSVVTALIRGLEDASEDTEGLPRLPLLALSLHPVPTNSKLTGILSVKLVSKPRNKQNFQLS
jgi:hypothetical protein